MVTYLTKSNASEGFNQIIDFLNESSIKYALTVNLNIYVSYIKQFWTTVAVKKVNDVTRLQALVDKKKVVITEATIRDALYLDDAEGVECLPNEEIFVELARMGYEKPSIKLTFYKEFFSSEVGKGFSRVETPLFEGMIVEQQVAKEGDADENVEDVNVGDAAKGDVSAANDEVAKEGDADENVEDVNVGDAAKGDDARIYMNLLQDLMDTCTALTRRVEHLELDKVPQAMEITKLKQNVKKLKRRNKGRMVAEMDQDADVVLEETKDVAVDAKADQDAKVDESVDIQGRQAESQEEIYKIDLDHANKVLSMQEDESEPAELRTVVDIVTTVKLITEIVTAASTTITAVEVPVLAAITVAAFKLTAAPSRRTKGVVIRDPKEEFEAELNRKIDWDKVIDHVKKKAKEDPAVKRYQVLKRKPQTEAQARKNMMIYLKNVVGFKMDYFKGISYDDICPIFEAKFNTNIIAFTTTQLILLVERKYPLIKFTVDQMLNDVRLKIKEENIVISDSEDFMVTYTEAPPSHDYVPGPEHPPTPEFVLEPVYPEFMPPEDDVLPAEEDDDDDEEKEEEEDSFRDKADDEEEEEHPASADSIPPPVHHTTARIFILIQAPTSFWSKAEIDRLLAIPSPPPSPLSPWSSPLPQIPSPSLPVSPPLPVSSPQLPASPTYPLGYRVAMIRPRAKTPSTSHPPPPIVLLHTRAYLAMLRAAGPSTYILASRSETPQSRTPPLLPIPLPTSSPPFLLPSTSHRADVLEVTLLPRKRLCIALGLRFKVSESSSAPTARPTEGFRADYGFVGTLDDEIRRDPKREKMAPKRTIRSTPATTTTTTTTHVTNAQLKPLIDQGVADALAVRDADRTRNGKDSHDSGTSVRRQAPSTYECT
nr:hypothetical protein [Tanacetum cinerariifolium]